MMDWEFGQRIGTVCASRFTQKHHHFTVHAKPLSQKQLGSHARTAKLAVGSAPCSNCSCKCVKGIESHVQEPSQVFQNLLSHSALGLSSTLL